MLAAPSARRHPPAAGASPPSAGSLHGFSMEVQEQKNWCWAAVSVSVASFYGAHAWTQCAVASAEFALSCCGQVMVAGCDMAWYLDKALRRVKHLKLAQAGSETFSVIQKEIAAGQPLGCHILWSGSGGHFVALGGWSVASDGTRYVDIHDPLFGLTQITYDDFLTSYRSPADSWDYTYFTAAGAALPTGGAAALETPTNA